MQGAGYLTGNFPEFLENIRKSNSDFNSTLAEYLAKTKEDLFRSVEVVLHCAKMEYFYSCASGISLTELEVAEQAKENILPQRQL